MFIFKGFNAAVLIQQIEKCFYVVLTGKAYIITHVTLSKLHFRSILKFLLVTCNL